MGALFNKVKMLKEEINGSRLPEGVFRVIAIAGYFVNPFHDGVDRFRVVWKNYGR